MEQTSDYFPNDTAKAVYVHAALTEQLGVGSIDRLRKR